MYGSSSAGMSRNGSESKSGSVTSGLSGVGPLKKKKKRRQSSVEGSQEPLQTVLSESHPDNGGDGNGNRGSTNHADPNDPVYRKQRSSLRRQGSAANIQNMERQGSAAEMDAAERYNEKKLRKKRTSGNLGGPPGPPDMSNMTAEEVRRSQEVRTTGSQRW